MKRKVFSIFFLLMLFLNALFIGYSSVKADANSDGETGDGHYVGGENAGAIYDAGDHLFMRVSLVYFDGKKTTNIGAKNGVKYFYVINPTNGYLYGYSSFNKAKYSIKYTTNQDFNWITYSGGKHFDFEEFERDTVGSNSYPSEEQYKRFDKYLKIFGVNRSQLNLPSCNVHDEGQGKCYGKPGYRLIGEIMTVRGNGQELSLKEYAKECMSGFRINGKRTCIESVRDGSVLNYSKEMFIRWQDINYRCPDGNCNSNKQVNCLSDSNCGWGIWIVDLSGVVQNQYDYSLDMACTNCKSNNSDSKAYVIQDTTNWEAIVNSESSIKGLACEGISSDYFKKDSSGTFCREEYHVYFPNENNRIRVQLGRYFTVNASDSEIFNNPIAADIPNFKPIKVTRIKQCKGGDLVSYNEKSCNTFKNQCTGDIKLKYTEAKYGYSTLPIQTLKRRENPDSASCNITGDMLTQEVTYSYTIDSNVYRYIRSVDGKAMKNKPTDNSFKYVDLGIGSLPVSFGNTSNKDSNSISVQLAYELPSDNNCTDSKMASLYTTENICSANKSKNVYQKFLDGENDDNERIEDSACAKLYKTFDKGNSEFIKCVNERTTNKTGNCFELNKIVNEPNSNSNYLCDTGDDCDSPEDAKKQGRGWNTCLKVCCPLMHKFNPDTCTCEPSDVGDECNENTPNRSWNKTTKKCCPIGKFYNEETKTCDDKPCGDDETFCNGVCIPKVKGVNICPPVIITPIGDSVVYRVISLKEPFVGQSGAYRKTGGNWCSYDAASGKYNCDSDNPTVKAVIPSNKTTYSEDEAMYKVTLDSSTISEIRKYNNKTKYDDWDLSCQKNGRACISEFLHNQVNVEGKCANAGKDSFYSCAD